ncbi:cytochrome b/b6 domain-containing protein [Hydrogenimonas thermophila]|uniref:Cytochrome b n=1 Tax=Hydrogenimonas thermophila TaxID=223786 RepID=A0A1I5UE75_9BACT|nr:cytochrome b/b6 domain-containing protein [Hydrogenimonas thermophila]SFP93529.1 Cytochrome b [Hydrogenimonas thermophila]
MQTYVWTLPTRIFHWMLVVYIVLMFLTSETESFLNIHAAFGYGVGILIIFRIFWGFIGPKYSKFAEWPLSIKEIIEFILNFSNTKKIYTGHNPAASFVMLGIIVTVLFATLTGILTYGIQEGRGVLSFLNSSFFKEMELFEEIHEFFANFLLLLVGMHIIGVIVDRLLHSKINTLSSMITGYKNIEADPASLNFFQKLFAVIMLLFAILIPLYATTFDSGLTSSRFVPVNYENEHSLFVDECSACHTLYPPFLLPTNSWKKLMATLQDHFGDDASLEKEDRISIEKFLLANSAGNSTKEAAFYITESLKGKKDIIAITKTPYWIGKHKNLDRDIFISSSIKSKANCKACHKDIEQGLIEDSSIKIPNSGV